MSSPFLRGVAVFAAGAAVTALVYFTGGTKLVYGHAAHIPVLLGAAAFAPWGGLVAAFFMMLALGPFMPLDVAADIAQQPINWLWRGGFLMLTGGTAGFLIHRVTRLNRAVEKAMFTDEVTGALRAAAQTARDLRRQETSAHHYWGVAVSFGVYGEVVRAWGTEAGDAVLRSAADLLRKMAPKAEVSRMHTDLFFVLAPNDRSEAGNRLAQALTAEPATLDSGDVAVRAELRVGLVPRQETPFDTAMIHHATLQALHDAQRSRQSLATFSRNDVEAESQRNLWMVMAAEQALGDSQFELLFQPKVSLIDGRTTGCEALIRWPHPERGTIHPGDFIPVVEPTSLMWPLTRWIVDTAVGQLAAWQGEGRDLGVAVNLSAHDLGEPGFVDYVRETIARHGVAPDRLTFELTETAMYEDAEHAGAALHALHGLGVKLAIDDFGTGYSSLATLQAFRFDQIKIDRQFVEHLTRDAKSLEIAGAVAALGKALHCTVVAEGIEDGGIVAALRDLGCTEGQGYHFAKPMAVDAFNAWLRDNERIAV